MSSPRPSPPETPSKGPNPSVEKENSAPRTPLPDAPVNGTDKGVVFAEANKPRNPEEEVQVPSTAPARVEARIVQPAEVHGSDQVEEEHRNDAVETRTELKTMGSEVAFSDLGAFDWEDLQLRYTERLKAVNKAEDEILEDFYKYSAAFSAWGEASANRDNERAVKRLRTRENFVRLGEASLEEKKKHYAEVVDAFKKALELLSR